MQNHDHERSHRFCSTFHRSEFHSGRFNFHMVSLVFRKKEKTTMTSNRLPLFFFFLTISNYSMVFAVEHLLIIQSKHLGCRCEWHSGYGPTELL